MEIAGYVKTSLIEWPGKISSVVFVPECNFKCPFCHNADLVLGQGFPRILEKQIFSDLENKKGWVEAVVVTGGEPTLQKDLSKFLKSLRSFKLLIMLHTNGTRPEVINELIIKKLTDYIAMDLKGDFENYERYTNVQCKMYNVRKSVELIAKSGTEHEFRTTVVPGLHDLKNLTKLARQIGSISKNSRWFLQQFRPVNCLDKKYLKVSPYSQKDLEKICQNLQKIIPNTSIRGV